MKELTFEHFERVLPLVRESGMQGHLTFVHAVLEGYQPGRVFVDDANNPKTALFCNLTGVYFGFGMPDEERVWPVVAEWLGAPLSEEWTDLFASNAAWKALLDRLLPLAERHPRRAFAFHPETSTLLKTWRDDVPDDLTMQPITAELAQSILDGTGTVEFGVAPWFVRIAGGPQAYAAHNLGVALVNDGQIASLCGFCALGNREAEMEVGTVPEYRGRGLAALVSAAFIEQCRANGWHPAYTCASDNLPSMRVACKLGFVEIEEVTGYCLNDIRSY